MPPWKYVAPVAEIVPFPERNFALLRSEGDWVPETIYWVKRLSAGDVVEVDPTAEARANATAITDAIAAGRDPEPEDLAADADDEV